MGIKLPDEYIEVSKGVYERVDARKKAAAKVKRQPQDPKPEQTVRNEPLAKVEGKEGDPNRLLVLIESVRGKSLDTENLAGSKFFTDFLRYIRAIPQDTEEAIDLRVTQRKPRKNEEEKTVIEVWEREV